MNRLQAAEKRYAKLGKVFPSQIDAITPMIRREREMYWEEKEKVAKFVEACEFALQGLNKMTTDEFSKGGDKAIRAKLEQALAQVSDN